jgi:hypothetical protein
MIVDFLETKLVYPGHRMQLPQGRSIAAVPAAISIEVDDPRSKIIAATSAIAAMRLLLGASCSCLHMPIFHGSPVLSIWFKDGAKAMHQRAYLCRP